MSYFKTAIIASAFLLTLAIAQFFPDPSVKDPSLYPDYEQIIPKKFGSWKLIEHNVSQIIDPEMQANLDKIYSQTVSRIYVDESGRSIMLSLAYGPDQRDGMNAHKPEVCYPAQGFEIKKIESDSLSLYDLTIPVKRLKTVSGARVEFVSYWILVGDKVTSSNIEKKMQQVKFRFRGEVPDGLLFRVSSIGSSGVVEYQAHNRFINTLIGSLKKSDRVIIIGVGNND